MAKETFPRNGSEMVVIPRERILPSKEDNAMHWPVQEIRFNRKNGILIIDVDEPDLVERIIGQPVLSEFNKHGYRPNEGLHMTVTGYENGEQILEALRPLLAARQEELVLAITGTAESIDWSWWPSGSLRHFQGRKSKALKIISPVECPGFNLFYDALSKLIPNADFKFYPPHITLLKRPAELNHRVPASIGGIALNNPLISLTCSTV